jgi:general secretion pathway protein C
MGRIAIWIANTALGVVCCFLVSRVILLVLAHVLLPAPIALSAAGAAPVPTGAGSARERQAILRRNLFNVSTLVVTAPVVEEEDLEATKLPLKLLGTAAAGDDRLSWAAVEDLETRQHTIVRVEDLLKQQAKVVRIERRRIVLENGSRREELALDDESSGGAVARPQRTSAVPASVSPQHGGPAGDPNLAGRVRKLAENRFAVARTDVENAARNPATLFAQARILPKYENGQMVGVQLNAVKPGSLFEQIGIQSGDTVTTFNGLRIDRPEQSANLLRELTEARSFNVQVLGSDGRERTLTYELQE